MFLFNLYQQIKCNITDAIWALVGFSEIYQKIKVCTSSSNTFIESFAEIKMCLYTVNQFLDDVKIIL